MKHFVARNGKRAFFLLLVVCMMMSLVVFSSAARVRVRFNAATGGNYFPPQVQPIANYTGMIHTEDYINGSALNQIIPGSVWSNALSGQTYDQLWRPCYFPTATHVRLRGYTFQGWYTSPMGGGTRIYGSSIVPEYDHEISAHWAPNQYTVFFNSNGGSSVSSRVVTFHTQYGTLPTPTKEGYVFDRWTRTDPFGTFDHQYSVGSSTLVEHDSNHTLLANWKAAPVTVTFDAGGGTATESSRSVTPETTYGTLPDATWEHHSFDGWYTAQTGGTKVETSSIVPFGDHTLYARWTELRREYTYNYNLNGGAGTTPAGGSEWNDIDLTLDSGAGISRVGHVLAGWLAADSAPAVITADGTAPAGLLSGGAVYRLTANTTFYAVWATDDDGNGEGDYLQRKVVYRPGTMNGLPQTVLLGASQNSFVTEEFPSSWSAVLGVFDGWRKEDNSIIAAKAATVFAPDVSGGKTMTLTAVTSTNGRTAMEITTAITDATEQEYAIGDPLHSKGVSVTVKYRDGNTEVYDTPTKISDAGITLKTENGKGLGTALAESDDGQKLIATKPQPDGGTITSSPSTQGIRVSDAKRKITLVVVGGDTVTDDILSVLDSSNQMIVKTNNTAQGEGIIGQTYRVAQSASLDTIKYQLQSLHINGVDHTADFADRMHDFVLEEDTTIYAMYHHDAQAGEYNVYANVISAGGTGTLQARRNNNGIVNSAPTGSFLGMISYDDPFAPTKLVAEGLEADVQYLGVALLPESGYVVGSVLMNGEFISEGDELWKTDSSGNVVIILPTDENGAVVDKTSYYIIVSYIRDSGADYTVNISSKTMDNGVEVTSIGTGNEVYLAGGGYSDAGHTISYASGATVQFGARPGTGYEITNVTLDGTEIAIGELQYHWVIPSLDDDREIVVTFGKRSDPSALEPDNEILRGAWAGESTGNVTFWITAGGVAVSPAEFDALTFEYSKALNWTTMSGDLHRIGTPVLTSDEKSEGGKIYSKVTIPVEVYESGVGAIAVKNQGNTLATAYVVTPGDANADGKISTTDLSQLLRVINETIALPGKGLANSFAFEMMDMNKDGNIRASDISAIQRIINGREFIRDI